MPPPGTEPVSSAITEDWQSLKDAVRRFESAWNGGSRPGIESYLPTHDALRPRVLIELVHIDLELRIKAGESPRIEEYVALYPELTEDETVLLDLVATEYTLRRRADSGVGLDEYLLRFPQCRADSLERKIRSISEDDGPATDGIRMPAGSLPESVPQVAGYEVLGLLGRGGMGAVYKARQRSLDRLVALKFLPRECARDPAWLSRFRREARTASALNHPYICTIYDTGESDGRPFLSMELVEGQTLEVWVRERRPVDEVARLIGQAAQALAAAHAAGIVHRDVKPANLMVRNDGILKVLDFGLARQLHAPVHGSTLSAESTGPGTRVGTLRYMSPEQGRAETVDASTDIFSLGLVLYELVTGQHPFHSDSVVGVLYGIINQTPVPPARVNPEVPAALDAFIRHMLAKDARLRPTALEVEAALAQIVAAHSEKSADRPAPAPRRPMVGRQKEGAALRARFDAAAAGRGSLVCVTGEPGLGKTTLVESFLEQQASDGRPMRLAHGRCSERLAGAEAYLPFLEALDSLLQGEDGASAAQEMKLLAPTWYVQVAPLTADDPVLARVLADAKQASQERRKREIAAFLQEISRRKPVVVFLDDVHWADPSSVDLLSYLGTRCSGWHVLIVLTYRPSDLLRSQHPFGPVKLELQGRGVCHEIALPFLIPDDLAHYLTLEFEGHRFPGEFVEFLHRRTEGNPLFVVDLLRYLRDSGLIVKDQGHWTLAQAVTNLQRQLPESVRGMIQRKIDQLGAADRNLLMAAAVQGPEFDSAVVAELLECDASDVEERLDVMERVHSLVRLVGEQRLPDGTLAVRYGFVHALYQEALYAALQPTRKAAWSAAAASALVGHYGEQREDMAADLAILFEAARDLERAADYYRMAADNAARIYAHHEAVSLARRGLALVQGVPESRRGARELPLLLTLGMQLQISQGFAAPEVERLYLRARALCEQSVERPSLFPVLWGLWMFYEVRGEVAKSCELADQLFTLAREPGEMLQARQAMVITSFCLGNPTAAREHMEAGVALYDPERHSLNTYMYGQDPRITSIAFGAVALWLLGYPDQAVQRSRQAVSLAEELGQPGTLALALHFACVLRQYRREPVEVRRCAEANTAIASEHGLQFWRASGLLMGGWALAETGSARSGAFKLQQGMIHWKATGGGTHHTYLLALLAQALGRDGQIQAALDLLTEAVARAERSGEIFHAAELHRLRGEFLLQLPGEVNESDAESRFHTALEIARCQRAKSLELRAAMSLTRLYRKQSREAEARPILADCYRWFTEGFDTPDLIEAREMLAERA